MKLYLFKNNIATLAGDTPRIIESERTGKLHVASTVIQVNAGIPAGVGSLRDGGYATTFVDENGTKYFLGYIKVSNGAIVAPNHYSKTELMLLRRMDTLEDELSAANKKIAALEAAFDTDSLNFLITQGERK